LKHLIWKNHKIQFSINQILNDEIEKKNKQLYKRIKKIKRMRIKIEKQNYFFIWLKGVIEKKNQFSKRTDKSKEWGSKLT
jgi:uncharacterized pyridoxamine 5'-phosphate oxidase family protein